MKRKIYERLVQWKNESQGKSALLIEGARRVGKSYIVNEFAKKEYKTSLVVDFAHVDKTLLDLFENDSHDLKMFFQKLSYLTHTKFIERKTLIVFDEIQMYPKARQLIKYLVKDGKYDFIETGSLISIHENVKGITIPSEEEKISMYPMDFEEFCWAMGDEVTVPYIRQHFNEKKPLGESLHKSTMEYFRQYMIVGGMPQAVECYAKTKDFDSVEKIKRGIITLYKDDVGKYAYGYRTKVSEMLTMIPSELSRHDKSFTISDIDENGRFSNYEEPIFWLADSMIANICYNSTKPERALGLNTNDSSLKIYMGDTGLLITLSIGEGTDDANDLYSALLMNKLHLNEGMYAENIVSQTLRCNGYPLYFHSFYLTDDEGNRVSNNRQEVDFLIPDNRKISPIEVKSGKNRGHASLRHLMEKYSKYLGQAYIIHTKDLEKKGNILFIPIYMTFCL